MTNQLWDARASAVLSAVRREVARRAVKSVRTQVEAAEGDWADHAASVKAAVLGFLALAECHHVILYAASYECAPGVYSEPADVGFPRAVRRAVRRIGPMLPAQAAMRGLDTVAASLGEASPVVQRMRANG
ncbi:MAG: hypothetical protein KF757_06870 [Phycisphaeraceae bacterium]|nr:hypothetical protein [Phycisphaeraceae bacterium]